MGTAKNVDFFESLIPGGYIAIFVGEQSTDEIYIKYKFTPKIKFGHVFPDFISTKRKPNFCTEKYA